ncbi:hypothetical protein [Clostridium felsineum]|uniref:Uncharacterized protein n=1 Tax=Clostridium felsineum TaxID=36839 RepID=A0A1S8MAE4_9CLOT|nr:hypothetical protein [Clostridium felsineum]URZ08790.1 hypothetical protein CLROS_041840 [Clostridium felsineum]URZ09418.1 hypothetical protein CROST_000890 [Clostridium felsineum]
MKKLRINIPIIIIILIIVGGIFALRPIKDISLPKSKGSINQQITRLNPKMSITSDRINTSISISEDDLNNILYTYIKDKVNLTGLETTVDSNRIKIYANTDILQVLPTQAIFEFVPYMKNDTVNFKLEKVSLGRITIPKSYYLDILKKINSDYISVNDDSITVKKEAISPLVISNCKANNGRVDLSVYYLTK